MSDPVKDPIKRDFESLVSSSNKGLPPLEHFMNAKAPNPISTQKEAKAMLFSTVFTRRPLFIAPVAVAAVACLLFLIPISYQKTAGWNVSLALSGPSLNPDKLRPIAGELKSALGVDKLELKLEQGQGKSTATMSAYIDAEKNSNPEPTARAFANYLSSKGIKALAESIPKYTQISSNVWAMTMDRVIRVETEGKTDKDIEDEIKARFEAAGIDVLEVTVRREDDNKTEIKIKAKCNNENDEGCGEPTSLVLTKNGEAPDDADKEFVKIRKAVAEGVDTLNIEIGADGKTATVVLTHSAGLNENDLIANIEEQLSRQNMDMEVKIEDSVLIIGKARIDLNELKINH